MDNVARVAAGRPDPALAVLVSLATGGAGVGRSYGALKEGLRTAVAEDPFDAAVLTVLGGAYLFYVAEKGHNPKVQTYWDALVFISTCMSVGYADVFARTPVGKAIASAVMTLGPAMSGAILDDPSAKRDQDDRVAKLHQAIVGKLDAIVGELRAARPAR